MKASILLYPGFELKEVFRVFIVSTFDWYPWSSGFELCNQPKFRNNKKDIT